MLLKPLLPLLGILSFLFLSGTVFDAFSFAINLKSNMLVLCGTFACCLISYHPGLIPDLIKNIQDAFTKNRNNFSDIIDQLEELSRIRRLKGIRELDLASRKIDNSFLKTGVEMIVDNYDRYTIFKTMERRYDIILDAKQSQSDLINSIIKLLPVFGFAGTIIGLINVLNHMGSPELIGRGVATALLTTFYGLLYANLVFLPISKKLAEKYKYESIELALIMEGILDISDNVNSKAIKYRLRRCIGDAFQYEDTPDALLPVSAARQTLMDRIHGQDIV